MLTGVPGVIWREGFAGNPPPAVIRGDEKRNSPRGRMTGIIDDADAQTRPQDVVKCEETLQGGAA